MNKLTAEVARRDIGHLKSFQSDPKVGLSMKEEKYLQALEIALPVLEQQEMITDNAPLITDKTDLITDTYRQIENDGWIEWDGGDRPVAYGAEVEVKMRNNATDGPRNAGSFVWYNGNAVRDEMDCDIIAYRVIENDGREG